MLMDGRTDDGQKVITTAHPENSSGELKKKKKIAKDLPNDAYAMFVFLFFFFWFSL